MRFKLSNVDLPRLTPGRRLRGQSFVELAIILPVLLVLLLGLIEVAAFICRYLDMLDLTREAARFASVRDPFSRVPASQWTCGPGASGSDPAFDFFYNTACIFSPPNTSSCNTSDPKFCNGLNTFLKFDPATDDIVISVFTVTYQRPTPMPPARNPRVTDSHPQQSGGPRVGNFWAFSDNDADTAHNANWSKDCSTTPKVVRLTPYYDTDRVNGFLSSGSGSPSKGLVAIEFYHCYNQVLALPMISLFIPNPMRIHAYTLMPLPAAQPSPTPRPSP